MIDWKWLLDGLSADTGKVTSAGNKSSVGTLVERKSRFVQLIKLDGATAAAALYGFSRAFERIPTDALEHDLWSR